MSAPGVIEHLPFRHRHAELAVGMDSETVKNLDQLRLRHDSGAAARKLALDPLEDLHVPPAAGERERAQQPAHRPADDEGARRAALPCILRHFSPLVSLL